MGHLGMWFSAGLGTAGLGDLRGISNPNDSVIPWLWLEGWEMKLGVQGALLC